MMVHDRSCSIFNAVYEVNKRTVVDTFEVQGLVETPPKSLQYLRKILRGGILEGHTASESAVTMGVNIGHARHN